MKLAIMQPYFFPYIGYFQLIDSVDLFIIYDNIQYTKKGWVNRNRILQNNKDVVISLPLKKDSDFKCICDRMVSGDYNPRKLLNKIHGAYSRAPYFSQTFLLLEKILLYKEDNLFRFLRNSIVGVCEHLRLPTKIMTSSDTGIDHKFKGQEKVIAICEAVNANVYINAIGGKELYSKDEFQKRGIQLNFNHSQSFEYTQFGNEFIPQLSIIDVMMFVPIDDITRCINENYIIT